MALTTPGSTFDAFMGAYMNRSGGLMPRTKGMLADRDFSQRQYEFGKSLGMQMAQMAEQRRQFEAQRRDSMISNIVGAVASTVGSLAGAGMSGGLSIAASKGIQAGLGALNTGLDAGMQYGAPADASQWAAQQGGSFRLRPPSF